RFSGPRGLSGGGLAGVIGGWAFGTWMAQVNFFPLIAGLVHSDSRMVGVTLHLIIAVLVEHRNDEMERDTHHARVGMDQSRDEGKEVDLRHPCAEGPAADHPCQPAATEATRATET